MSDPSKLEFFPKGLFHDAVTAYLAAMSGLMIFHPKFPVDLATLKPIGVATNEAPALEIRPFEIKQRFLRGDFPLSPLTDSLIRLLANWTYEHAQDAYSSEEWLKLRETNPMLEFFRHLRNASSHREGLWSFRGDEPKRPAEWRGRKLEKSLQDRPIWEAGLKPGDILFILWDIEQLLIKHKPQGGW